MPQVGAGEFRYLVFDAVESLVSTPVIAVVIPAYRVAPYIAGVVGRVPAFVRHIIVVDDASPDGLASVVASLGDPRVVSVRHEVNRGVGGAMKTGFAKGLELGADIVAKVDGDGQMDPALLEQMIEPIASGNADLAKGNRFDDLSVIRRMPLVRRVGNLALSFLVKLASGYWSVFDPCNGYIACRAGLLRRITMARLDDRYFFEISLLCEAYFADAVLRDVPMAPVYAGETSSLSPVGSIPHFSVKLIGRAAHRLFKSYFMRDFNVVSLFVVSGVPALVFGAVWSAYHWARSSQLGVVTPTGTVMIGVLAIVLGFQLVLQALVADVANEPGRQRQ